MQKIVWQEHIFARNNEIKGIQSQLESPMSAKRYNQEFSKIGVSKANWKSFSKVPALILITA